MRHAQLARDVARPNALSRQIDYLVAHEVRQRAPVDKVPAELVDAWAAVAWRADSGAGVGAVAFTRGRARRAARKGASERLVCVRWCALRANWPLECGGGGGDTLHV